MILGSSKSITVKTSLYARVWITLTTDPETKETAAFSNYSESGARKSFEELKTGLLNHGYYSEVQLYYLDIMLVEGSIEYMARRLINNPIEFIRERGSLIETISRIDEPAESAG